MWGISISSSSYMHNIHPSDMMQGVVMIFVLSKKKTLEKLYAVHQVSHSVETRGFLCRDKVAGGVKLTTSKFRNE